MTHADWMGDDRIQQKPFSQIVLPGTHDSAAYSLTYSLSEVKYDDIAFLWDLDKGKAPNMNLERYYVGPQLYDFIFDIAMSVAKAGKQSILNQLNGGIRYFDLRVYRDNEYKSLYTQHGLRGCSLETVFNEVGTFVHSGGRELVILELSRIVNSRGIEDTNNLIDLLEKCIGREFLYKPSSIEELSTTLLKDITASGSKVIILGNKDDLYPVESPVLTEEFYQTSGRDASGVDTVDALSKAEEKGLKDKRDRPFYHVSWSLTPQMQNIASEIISRLVGKQPQLILQNLANLANSSLESFIRKNQKYPFQLITVDWYETSPVVDLAIELSRD